jgi:hypothetical protein
LVGYAMASVGAQFEVLGSPCLMRLELLKP